MKNLTDEEKSQSYFFIFIVVGVAAIIGVSFLIITYQIDEHIAQYHAVQEQSQPKNIAEPVQMEESNDMNTLSEESVEALFDEGDAFEDADMDLDAIDDEMQVDDITL